MSLIRRSDLSQKSLQTFNIPERKSKNINCVYCRRTFFIKDPYCVKGPCVPLIRHCGHSVCEECSKRHRNISCTLCEHEHVPSHQASHFLPINFYVTGLMVAQNSRPIDTVTVNDVDFEFRKSMNSIIKKKIECCFECKIATATCRCLECTYPYCNGCFTTFHSFQSTQHHNRIILDIKNGAVPNLPITCTTHQPNLYKHWCIECKVRCCTDCIVYEHRTHSTTEIQELNKLHRKGFLEAYENLANGIGQVYNAKKEIKQALTFPEEVDNSANVEFQINQHFVYLHGILQNLEDQMIEILHTQRNSRLRNLIEIQEELQSLETQLQNAILMTNLAESQSESVIQSDVVEVIKHLFNIQCYIVKNEIDDKNTAGSITFSADPSFIESMKNHCNVTVQPVPKQYSLVTADKLPEDYVIATVDRQSLHIPPLFILPSQEHTSKPGDSMLESSVVSGSTSLQSLVETDSRKGYEIHITYIGNPYCFYIRKKEDDHLYEAIESELMKYNKMTDMLPEEILEGEIYVVRDPVRKWFRGRVKSSSSDPHQSETYQILAIDYGFINKKINRSRLRKILPKLAEIPPLAQKHKLFDIYPINGKVWSKESVEAMREICAVVKDKLPRIYDVNNDLKSGCDLLIPTTINNDPLSVRDTLLFLGHGKFITSEKLFRINPSASNAYHHEQLEMDVFHNIVCLNIESPLCFYVRKANYNESYFQKMIIEMTNTYRSTKKLKSLVYNPSIGMNCAVPFEGSWHRGVISNIPGVKKIEVYLVDLGVKTTMSYNKIRRLDPCFTVANIRAIKISLRDVTIPDDGWRLDTKNIMIEFMNPTAQMIISSKTDDCYIASILNHNNISLNNVLDAKRFTGNNNRLLPSSPLNSLTNSPKKKSNRSKTKSKSNKHCPIIIDEDKNKNLTTKTTSVNMQEPKQDENPYLCCVNVMRVVSPDEIYLATTNRTETFDEIHDKIQKFYNKQRAIVAPDMSQGAMCAVHLSTNSAYYRAKIIVVHDDNVKVFLIDEGKYETVSKDSIQCLADELHDIPAFLFKVRLAGIYPTCGKTTWTSVTCDRLIEIVNANENRNFFIAKVGETVNEAMTVDLFVKQAKIIDPIAPTVIEMNSVNRMLIEEGVALPIKNYNDKKLKVLAADIKKEMNFYDENTVTDDVIEIIEEKKVDEIVNCNNTIDPPRRMTKYFPTGIPTWLPPDPITKNSFLAHVTYIDYDGFVYLHTMEQSAELKSIDQKLQNYFKFKQLKTNVIWKSGDMCIASFKDDACCRGVVHQVLETDIAVEFVDYGDLEWINPSDLSTELMLTDVPSMASKCQIYGLISANGTWNLTELAQLHTTIVDRVCSVTVLRKKNDYYIIQINDIEDLTGDFFGYLLETFHMNLHLLDKTFDSDADSTCSANIYPEVDDQNDNTSADVVVEGILEDNTDENPEVNDMNDIKPNELSKNFTGSVCSNESNDEIIHSHEDNFIIQKAMKNIVDRVSSQCETYEKPSLSLADDTTDSEKEYDTTDENYVEDDDDDEVDIINTDEYYPLPPNNTKFNQLHLPAKEDIISNNMLQSLNYNGKYVALNLPTVITEFHAAIGEIDKNKSNIVWLHPCEIKDHSLLNCYRKIYITIQSEMESEAILQPLLNNFDPEIPCCAKYKGIWHRGQIVSSLILSGMIQVLYVDWGNTEWVKTSELHRMKRKWFNLPTLAIKCRLWNTRIACNEKAKNWLQFKRDNSNELYKIKVVGRESDHFIVKIFENNNEKILMYQDLIDQGIFLNYLKDHYLMKN